LPPTGQHRCALAMRRVTLRLLTFQHDVLNKVGFASTYSAQSSCIILFTVSGSYRSPVRGSPSSWPARIFPERGLPMSGTKEAPVGLCVMPSGVTLNWSRLTKMLATIATPPGGPYPLAFQAAFSVNWWYSTPAELQRSCRASLRGLLLSAARRESSVSASSRKPASLGSLGPADRRPCATAPSRPRHRLGRTRWR
jgi:hypothetical protein